MSLRHRALGPSVLLALAACGDPFGAGRGVSLPEASLALSPCEERELDARAPGALVWSSSAPEVARVDSRGRVRAVMPGTATVVAALRADSAKRASVEVTVARDGLAMVLGPELDDTVGALPARPLEARLTWARGCPAAGLTVSFSSPRARPPRFTGPDPVAYFGTGAAAVLAVRTDAAGRAATPVRLASIAGSFHLHALAVEAGAADSVRLVVRPGSPVSLEAAPRDTAAYPGRGYALRLRVLDRSGNATPAAVVVTARSPEVAGFAGGRVEAARHGRAVFRVQSGPLVDSVQVSVVPRGTLAASRVVYSSGVLPGVLVTELDGTRLRTLYESGRRGHNLDMAPDWSPDGSRLVFHDVLPTSLDFGLIVSDTLGSARALFPPAGSRAWGSFSPDGRWVYFLDGPMPSRGPADGSAPPEALLFDPGFQEHRPGSPSVSPAGTHFVYSRSGVLRLFDVAARTHRSLGISGQMPRWSPGGDLVAYLADERIWVMRPDGTARRAVTAAGARFGEGLYWSPDGAWLVSRSGHTGVLHVVEAATGLSLPLSFTPGMAFPAWRR